MLELQELEARKSVPCRQCIGVKPRSKPNTPGLGVNLSSFRESFASMLGPSVAPGILKAGNSGLGYAGLQLLPSSLTSFLASFLPSFPPAPREPVVLGLFCPPSKLLGANNETTAETRQSCPHNTCGLVGRQMLNEKHLNSTEAYASK